jgi:hypothetical protein
VVVGVGEVEIVGGVKREAGGRVDGGGGGGTVVSGEALSAVACNGGDDAGRDVDAANAVVAGVSEVEIVLGVDCERDGEVELGAGGGAAIARKTGSAIAGDRGEDVGGKAELADDVIVRVGDVKVVGGVESETLR